MRSSAPLYKSVDGVQKKKPKDQKKYVIYFTAVVVTIAIILTASWAVEWPAEEEEGDMKLYSLADWDPSAVCNDGSPAAFYYNEAPIKAGRYVIYLEGGSFCFNGPSCEERAVDMPDKVTSNLLSQTRTGTGILSYDKAINPQWSDANHVNFVYCSSDLWVGNTSKDENDVLINGETWNHMGYRILESGMRYLHKEFGLVNATEILFAARTSAASGAMAFLPEFQDLLEELAPNANHVFLLDSGWNLDTEPYLDWGADCVSINECNLKDGVMLAEEMWQPVVSEGCKAEFAGSSDDAEDEIWKCFYGSHAYKYFTKEAFFGQFQSDVAGLGNLGIALPLTTEEEEEFVMEIADKYRQEFIAAGVNGYFNPACLSHGIIDKDHVAEITINGTALLPAFMDWTMFGQEVNIYDTCANGTYACNPTC